MSWKIYSFGNVSNVSDLSKKVMAKLGELGYQATSGSIESQKVLMTVTVDGVDYTGYLYSSSTSSHPYYLCYNDETKDILVTCVNTGTTKPDWNLYGYLCFAILSGVKIETGEPGLFVIADPRPSANFITNPWVAHTTTDFVVLQKVVFVVSNNNSYAACNANNFVSTLYWGSARHDPGAVIEVGADRFVCLSGWLYAKV